MRFAPLLCMRVSPARGHPHTQGLAASPQGRYAAWHGARDENGDHCVLRCGMLVLLASLCMRVSRARGHAHTQGLAALAISADSADDEASADGDDKTLQARAPVQQKRLQTSYYDRFFRDKLVLTSKKISFLKVAFLRKNWPKNNINRQKKSILQLPAALGRAMAKLPKFIELSDCQSRLYANHKNT